MLDPVTACVSIIEDHNAAIAARGRLLRAAEDNRPLRLATREEIALSDSSPQSAGIICVLLGRGSWTDAYAEPPVVPASKEANR